VHFAEEVLVRLLNVEFEVIHEALEDVNEHDQVVTGIHTDFVLLLSILVLEENPGHFEVILGVVHVILHHIYLPLSPLTVELLGIRLPLLVGQLEELEQLENLHAVEFALLHVPLD